MVETTGPTPEARPRDPVVGCSLDHARTMPCTTLLAALLLAQDAIEPPPPPSASGTLEVAVITRSDGLPVPGAEIWYLAEEGIGLTQLGPLGLHGQDAWAQMAHFGTRVVADEKGLGTIPLWERGVMAVQARHDGMYDLRNLREAPAEGATCKLRRRGSARFLVRDAQDRPLEGVWLGVRSDAQGLVKDLTSAPTVAGTGETELVFLERFAPNADAGETLSIVQLGHFEEVPGVSLDPRKVPEGVQPFRGLPVGSVALAIAHEDETPVIGPVEIEVTCLGGGTSASPRVLYVTDTSALTIPQVGLNTTLRVVASRPGGAVSAELDLTGPEDPGREVTAALTFREQDVLVFGRLLGLDGAPAYKTLLTCRLFARSVLGQNEYEAEVVTEADGSFFALVPLQARIPLERAQVELILTDPNDGSVRGVATWQADSGGTEEGRITKGAVDVGELRLAPPAG